MFISCKWTWMILDVLSLMGVLSNLLVKEGSVGVRELIVLKVRTYCLYRLLFGIGVGIFNSVASARSVHGNSTLFSGWIWRKHIIFIFVFNTFVNPSFLSFCCYFSSFSFCHNCIRGMNPLLWLINHYKSIVN